jgi:hypothetical protein
VDDMKRGSCFMFFAVIMITVLANCSDRDNSSYYSFLKNNNIEYDAHKELTVNITYLITGNFFNSFLNDLLDFIHIQVQNDYPDGHYNAKRASLIWSELLNFYNAEGLEILISDDVKIKKGILNVKQIHELKFTLYEESVFIKEWDMVISFSGLHLIDNPVISIINNNADVVRTQYK